MTNWLVKYWDGCMLRQCIVYADYYNLINSISSSPASSFTYSIISIERVAQ